MAKIRKYTKEETKPKKSKSIEYTKCNGRYTEEEDAKLIELYEKYHNRPNLWKLIADELNRGHKSVRGRYVNHLDPTLKKYPLTKEEKLEIDKLCNTGIKTSTDKDKKWVNIARILSENRMDGIGRVTELQVKNYWNSKSRSVNRKEKKESFNRIRKSMNIE